MDWKPGCPEWTAENGSPQAEQKRRLVLEKLVREDHAKSPSAELVRAWHRALFSGIAPHADYLGFFRDKEDTPPCLQDYEVEVGGIPGVASGDVISAVEKFFKEFSKRLDRLEKVFPVKGDRPPNLEEVSRVVELAAWAHGEWVWIHPFANGNGRTARLLANYIFVRFGFGPAVSVRPRPEQPYGLAARASMADRDHGPMEAVLWQLLADSYV